MNIKKTVLIPDNRFHPLNMQEPRSFKSRCRKYPAPAFMIDFQTDAAVKPATETRRRALPNPLIHLYIIHGQAVRQRAVIDFSGPGAGFYRYFQIAFHL